MQTILKLCFCFIIGNSFAQIEKAEVLAHLNTHVLFLANDSLEGRATGSKGESMANDYVLNFFKTNYKGKIYHWNFEIPQDSGLVKTEMVGYFINHHSKQTLIIGAHLDHIGYGGKLSKSIGRNDIHNGADDNASGVAVLLELSKLLSSKKLTFNLLFVPFTAHEIGLYGSSYLYNNWNKKFGSIFGMINFDMVGRMAKVNPTIYYTNSQNWENSLITTEHPDFKLSSMDSTRLDLLDTKIFHSNNINVVTFTTGMHDDYHKTTDDSEFLNLKGMYDLTKYVESWILNLNDSNPVKK